MTGMIQWNDQETLKRIKTVYCKDLTENEFITFLSIGQATGLNPFNRELWAVKYGKNPAQIFIGRDGYRRIAVNHSEYDYHNVDAVYENDKFSVINGELHHEYGGGDRGGLMGAYCVVKRKASNKPFFNYVALTEYNTGSNPLWKSKPATMIKKVAEAQALRAAFPNEFNGTYDESEKWEQPKVEVAPTKSAKKKTTKAAPVKEAVDVDSTTGELIENPMTEAQRKKIFAQFNELFELKEVERKSQSDAIKGTLLKYFNKDSISQLDIGDASELIGHLDQKIQEISLNKDKKS